MKIDKQVRNISDRLDSISSYNNGKGHGKNYDNDDDHDYYLDIGSEPPSFAYYRHVRFEKLDESRKEDKIGNGYDIDKYITQEELDFVLKRQLRVPPEQRYQNEKYNWFFHDLSYLDQTKTDDRKAVDIIKEYGCGHESNDRSEGLCVPECRYYAKHRRIEDSEVIEEHNKRVESLRQQNAIVEPPDLDTKEAYSFFAEHPSLLK